jgi:hypothetical protein
MGPHTPQARGHEAVTVVQAGRRRRRASGSTTCRPPGNSYSRLTSLYLPSAKTASCQASDWVTTASGSASMSDSHTARGTGLVITGRPFRDFIAFPKVLLAEHVRSLYLTRFGCLHRQTLRERAGCRRRSRSARPGQPGVSCWRGSAPGAAGRCCRPRPPPPTWWRRGARPGDTATPRRRPRPPVPPPAGRGWRAA